MPILVTCSSCSSKVRAPDAAAGRKVKCPKCQTPISVPTGNAPAPAAAGKPAADKPSAVKKTAPAAPAKAASADKAKAAPTAKTKTAPTAKAAPAEKATAKPAPANKATAQDEPVEVLPADDGGDWEQSALLQHNEWTFREQGWVRLNIKNRHFHICKADTKDPIGYADEKASGLFLALRVLNNVGKWLPTTVEIRDEQEGPLLLSIRKINIPLLPWTDIEIYDGQKQKLGYFRTKIFSLLGGFWLYDAEGKEVAEVKAKLGLPPRYLFLSKDGRELGSVANETMAKVAETKKATVTVSGPFSRPSLRLKVAPEMAEEPKVKVLMLATVLAFEFTGVGNRLLKAT